MAVDWSTLPLELLGDIAIKLDSIEDFIYFPAVCRSWNRASSSITHLWSAPSLPWLLLAENTNENPNCLRNIFNLNNNKRYSLNLPETFGARCWGSPYGWVAVAKRDLTIQLFNPITKTTISFPSLQTIPDLPTFGPEEFENSRYDYYQWILTIFLKKLIVLEVSQTGGHSEYVIMLLSFFTKGPTFARRGDESWTTILIKESGVRMLDVIATKDHVFALYDDYNGEIAYWNVKELYDDTGVVKPMAYSPGKYGIFKRLNMHITRAYLVQSGTDLFMVVRFKQEVLNSDGSDYDYNIVYQTRNFKIYKLNPKHKNWENVEDLGNVALFVGDNSSMSVSLAHEKGLQPNCIYFTDDESEVWMRSTKCIINLGGHDMGIFNMRTDNIERFYEGDDSRSSFCTPTWFIPQFQNRMFN